MVMKLRRAAFHLNHQKYSVGTTFSCFRKIIISVTLSSDRWRPVLNTYWANYPVVQARKNEILCI